MTIDKIIKFALLIFALYMTDVTWAADIKPVPETKPEGILQRLFGDITVYHAVTLNGKPAIVLNDDKAPNQPIVFLTQLGKQVELAVKKYNVQKRSDISCGVEREQAHFGTAKKVDDAWFAVKKADIDKMRWHAAVSKKKSEFNCPSIKDHKLTEQKNYTFSNSNEDELKSEIVTCALGAKADATCRKDESVFIIDAQIAFGLRKNMSLAMRDCDGMTAQFGGTNEPLGYLAREPLFKPVLLFDSSGYETSGVTGMKVDSMEAMNIIEREIDYPWGC